MSWEAEKILRKLKDGEWHTFKDDGFMAMRMRPYLRQGYIAYSEHGDEVQMIATDKGIEYIAMLEHYAR
jgi:hypothetical protein